MKKTTPQKLVLSRETVARLATADLTRLAGGVPKTIANPDCDYSAWSYDSCPTTVCP
jgi:hypothetical protein